MDTDEATDGRYPTISLNTNVGVFNSETYETFIGSLRNYLKSGDKSHDIDLLRKQSEINKEINMFLEVELFYNDVELKKKVSITLALHVLNANVIAYKSENNSFFLMEASPEAKTLIFNETKKHHVDVYGDYDYTSKTLSGGELRKAIRKLHDLKDASNIETEFKERLIVILQMVVHAARFKVIQKYIESNLENGYQPQDDTYSYETSWVDLSKQIQLSDSNGRFKTAVVVQNADDSLKYIRDVAHVESDIAILLNDG